MQPTGRDSSCLMAPDKNDMLHLRPCVLFGAEINNIGFIRLTLTELKTLQREDGVQGWISERRSRWLAFLYWMCSRHIMVLLKVFGNLFS